MTTWNKYGHLQFYCFFSFPWKIKKRKTVKSIKARTTGNYFILFWKLFFFFLQWVMRNGLRGSRELKAKPWRRQQEQFLQRISFIYTFLPSADTGPDPQRETKEKRMKTEHNWQNNTMEKSDIAQTKTESTLIYNSMGGGGCRTTSDFNMIQSLRCKSTVLPWSAGLMAMLAF